ncbi:glycine zipper 2TM domain-containing protein [Croceicoccus sp. F390]|uniref:17 kDa surface antigen n=1 Tax=Croceicoccus esteveae TaxID=3075597 RepID=A0ABU2ZFF5_9SPHN|nr:glycine zipper 2TM domain-containing protein [Croceicoccus sp. F390]MDT0575332.1 glycine zipper 2TM domain-containing protein [Croceicoccus sp. F390]
MDQPFASRLRIAAIAAGAPALMLCAPAAQAVPLSTPAQASAQFGAPVGAILESENVENRRDRERDRYYSRRDYRDYRNYRNDRRDRDYDGYRYSRYDEPVRRDTRVWRGRDNRYYCKKDNGTTGLLIGGAVGGVIGNEVAGRGDRTLGALLGAAGGALLGREIDRSGSRCR